MAKLTKQYIEDHLVGAHTLESWAREIVEMALKAASAQLEEGSAEEVVIDSQIRISAVEAEVTRPAGETFTRSAPCVRVCVVISPTGLESCYHKTLPI
jgi:hypothetical protein